MDAYIDPKEDEITHPLGWERRTLTPYDQIDIQELMTIDGQTFYKKMPEEIRNWLLGGKEMDWRYEKNILNGDIILWRR